MRIGSPFVWLLALGAFAVGSTTMAASRAAAGPNGRMAFTGYWTEHEQIFRVDVATGRQVNLTRSESFNGPLANVSPDGSTILFRRLFQREAIWRMDADGNHKRQLARGGAPAWSPDGKRIVYTDERGFVTTMATDGGDRIRLVPGRLPVWSPDGRWIAYVDGSSPLTVMVVGADGSGARSLYSTTDSFLSVLWSPDATHLTVAADDVIVAALVTGGAARVLAADVSGLTGPEWSPDGGRIAFARAGQLFTMSAAGGDPIALTPARSAGSFDSPGTFDTSPKWSPDGRSLAFIRVRTTFPRGHLLTEEIWIVPAKGGEARRVPTDLDDLTRSTRLSWSSDGRSLVYSRARTGRGVLSVQPDGTKLSHLALGGSDPAFSPDGSSIAFTRNARSVSNAGLFVMRADGSGVRRLTPFNGEGSPSWSPDSSRILFTRHLPNEGALALYTIRSDGTRLSRLRAPTAVYLDPAWSPDGLTIAVVRDGTVITMDPDGRRARRLVGFAGRVRNVSNLAWSPSGDWISFVHTCYSPACNGIEASLWTAGPRGEKPRKLIENVSDAAWSPDGTRLAVLEAANRNVRIVSASGKRLSRLRFKGDQVSWQPICTRSGGLSADRLSGDSGDELICGLGGADRITGGPGRDRLFGGEGNDTIDARDGTFDVVGCGPGRDSVVADRSDYVGVDCERVTRR